jgi:hypothetical protein
VRLLPFLRRRCRCVVSSEEEDEKSRSPCSSAHCGQGPKHEGPRLSPGRLFRAGHGELSLSTTIIAGEPAPGKRSRFMAIKAFYRAHGLFGLRPGPTRFRTRSAERTPCYPGVTRELGKWSGRLDSNQRPPAPKCTVVRRLATLCDAVRCKSLISSHFGHRTIRRTLG